MVETVRIKDLAPGGDGFGYFRDSPVFVSLTAPGDLVVPGDVKRSRGVLFASPAVILEESALRRDPPCPYFGDCGGCSWMHLPYSVQLEYKKRILMQVLERIGKVRTGTVRTIIPAPAEFKWRHRIRIHHSRGRLGFFKRYSRELVEWDRCLITPDLINRSVSLLREIFKDRSEVLDRVKWVEVALSPVDCGISLAWFFEAGFQGAGFTDTISRCSEVLSAGQISLSAQSVFVKGRSGPVFSRGTPLKIKSAGSDLSASPGTFFQVNPRQNDHLVGKVLSILKNRSVKTLVDLYCGNGNFSLPCAEAGIQVTGVESAGGAVEDAKRASRGRNPRFVKSKVENYAGKLGVMKFDAVLVDPPRAGLPKQVREKVRMSGAATLVYVSCDPATLARDLAVLTGGGYRIVSIEPLDMFPQSHHLESVALLENTG